MNSIYRNYLPALILLLLLALPLLASAKEVWLMTYGTGDLIEERFGHNALWVRDSERDIDHIYNFGFFDFDQPGFYRNYLFGQMMYFAVARDPAEELNYYQWRDREVLAQRLDLSNLQIDRLTDWLELNTSPENRNFRYDYYFNNCSNRVRDGLDYALNGWLRDQTEVIPADQNLRAHTRRLIQDSPLLYLGIQTGLGRQVDQPRSAWDAMFLPEVVSDQVRGLSIQSATGQSQPLVMEERVLHSSSRNLPPEQPIAQLWPFLLLGLFSAMLIALPLITGKYSALFLLPVRIWLLTASLAGLSLLFLWFFTDHHVTRWNENLLLLSPLMLGLINLRFSVFSKLCAVLLSLGLVLALLLKLFDGAQWNYDLMLWWWPAQLAAIVVWYQCCQARSGGIDRA